MIIRTHNRLFYYSASLIGKILNSKIIFYDQLDLELKEFRKNNLINFLKNFEFKLKIFFQSIELPQLIF